MYNTIQNWMKTSISLKLATIAILAVILLIPRYQIESLIFEREQRQKETMLEISNKWGKSQTLCAPVLNVPYKVFYETQKGTSFNIEYAHFLPETLTIKGDMAHQTRYRSIYKVIVYNSKFNFSGSFNKPDFSTWKINPDNILWDEAYLSIGISDLRGLNENIAVSWNKKNYTVVPGTVNKDIVQSGVTSKINITEEENYNFEFNVDLNGSDYIYFTPLGKETKVELKSDWHTPSFDGAFLPDSHHITDKGFTAKWHILHLNRNYPQQWIGKNFKVQNSSFGVQLKLPVNLYQKITRANKYAFLFIVLTFTLFFFVEVLAKLRIHPIQYLLVGFGLLAFFSLLLSLAEHIGFNLAYLAGSSAIIVLLTYYVNQILVKKKIALIVLSLLIILYTFLFTILQMADYSLLIGNIALFIILAVVMYISRKVDWYQLNSNNDA